MVKTFRLCHSKQTFDVLTTVLLSSFIITYKFFFSDFCQAVSPSYPWGVFHKKFGIISIISSCCPSCSALIWASQKMSSSCSFQTGLAQCVPQMFCLFHTWWTLHELFMTFMVLVPKFHLLLFINDPRRLGFKKALVLKLLFFFFLPPSQHSFTSIHSAATVKQLYKSCDEELAVMRSWLSH